MLSLAIVGFIAFIVRALTIVKTGNYRTGMIAAFFVVAIFFLLFDVVEIEFLLDFKNILIILMIFIALNMITKFIFKSFGYEIKNIIK